MLDKAKRRSPSPGFIVDVVGVEVPPAISWKNIKCDGAFASTTIIGSAIASSCTDPTPLNNLLLPEHVSVMGDSSLALEQTLAEGEAHMEQSDDTDVEYIDYQDDDKVCI